MSERSLSEAIRELRAELSTALVEGEGERLKFALGPVELELLLELATTAGGKAELKWVVVTAGGEAKHESMARHRIKLVLTPVLDGKSGFAIGEITRPGQPGRP